MTIFCLKMWTMRVFCRGTIVTQLLAFLAASLHHSTSELPGDLHALKKARLVMNEGGDGWSPWNDRVNENSGTVVVQECNKCLSEIVHKCISTSIVFIGSAMVWKHTSFSVSSIMGA